MQPKRIRKLALPIRKQYRMKLHTPKQNKPAGNPVGLSFCSIGLIVRQRLFQSLCQLIGAGGGLHAALDALQAGDHLIDRHSLCQQGDTLCVAAAPADKADV